MPDKLLPMATLTPENYKKGFLVDDQLMAGVTEHPEQAGLFVAFVLQHTTGEYLGYQPFTELEQALQTINSVKRAWIFEKVGGCGGCKDGECGVEAGGGCKKGKCASEGC